MVYVKLGGGTDPSVSGPGPSLGKKKLRGYRRHSKIITKGPRWKLFWKVLSNFFGYYVTWHMSNMKFKGSLVAYYALYHGRKA